MISIIRKSRKSVCLVLVYTFILLMIAILCGGCTDYERAGYNPKPFNGPAYWEHHPYGEMQFQN